MRIRGSNGGTNAAGTLSHMDTKLSDMLFEFQLLAGVDYALTNQTSVGVKARWAQFDKCRDRGSSLPRSVATNRCMQTE